MLLELVVRLLNHILYRWQYNEGRVRQRDAVILRHRLASTYKGSVKSILQDPGIPSQDRLIGMLEHDKRPGDRERRMWHKGQGAESYQAAARLALVPWVPEDISAS